MAHAGREVRVTWGCEAGGGGFPGTADVRLQTVIEMSGEAVLVRLESGIAFQIAADRIESVRRLEGRCPHCGARRFEGEAPW